MGELNVADAGGQDDDLLDLMDAASWSGDVFFIRVRAVTEIVWKFRKWAEKM